MSYKECKQRYFDKKYLEAPIIKCACGCGQELKALDKYARPHKFISGHNGRKYSNPKQYKWEWNKKNKQQKIDYKRNERHERKVFLVNYKGNICTKCSTPYNGKNASMFDFHHLRDKQFAICQGSMDKSMEELKIEADKCVLVCSNCHRKIHSEEY